MSRTLRLLKLVVAVAVGVILLPPLPGASSFTLTTIINSPTIFTWTLQKCHRQYQNPYHHPPSILSCWMTQQLSDDDPPTTTATTTTESSSSSSTTTSSSSVSSTLGPTELLLLQRSQQRQQQQQAIATTTTTGTGIPQQRHKQQQQQQPLRQDYGCTIKNDSYDPVRSIIWFLYHVSNIIFPTLGVLLTFGLGLNLLCDMGYYYDASQHTIIIDTLDHIRLVQSSMP